MSLPQFGRTVVAPEFIHRLLQAIRERVRRIPLAVPNALSRPVATTGLILGSANTWLVSRSQGILDCEPSCLAIDSKTRRVRKVGATARVLDGREPDGLELSRPLVAGRVLRRDDSIAMIRHFLRAVGHFGQSVIVAVPHGLTPPQRHILEQVVLRAGARKVHLVDEALAAILGTGVDVFKAEAVMAIDLGASSTRISLVAMGEVMLSESVYVGGNAMDEAIQNYLADIRQLKVGLPTAERVKTRIGCALPLKPRQSMDVDGISLATGVPTRVQVTSKEICEALQPVLSEIVDHVRRTLEDMRPQTMADVTEKGVTLIGAGAQLGRLGDYLSAKTNFKVHLSEEPEQAAARGMVQLLGDARLRRSLLSPASRTIVALPRAVRRSNGLAWALGLFSLLLVWQVSGAIMARTTAVDRTLTTAMEPLWNSVNHMSKPFTAPALAVDPARKILLDQLRDTQRRLHAATQENLQLRHLTHTAGRLPRASRSLGAQVVARDPGAWMQTLVLDVGRQRGVGVGMPVITENGVVGYVSDVSTASSRVHTITFHGALTPAMIEKRHAAGVVYGVDGRSAEMRFIDPSLGVKAGDVVTTSGADRYPQGLVVGQVTQVHPSVDGVTLTAVVRPDVGLDSVRDVLVVEDRGK